MICIEEYKPTVHRPQSKGRREEGLMASKAKQPVHVLVLRIYFLCAISKGPHDCTDR